MEQTTITAPLDGRVTLRNSEPGEVITPGFPILRLADLSEVHLRVFVPEPRVGLVKLGQDAEVVTDTYPMWLTYDAGRSTLPTPGSTCVDLWPTRIISCSIPTSTSPSHVRQCWRRWSGVSGQVA